MVSYASCLRGTRSCPKIHSGRDGDELRHNYVNKTTQLSNSALLSLSLSWESDERVGDRTAVWIEHGLLSLSLSWDGDDPVRDRTRPGSC